MVTDLSSWPLDIDALRAVKAIRRHGGVTPAAEAPGLTQSAVSLKIKRLESSLACEILARKAGLSLFTQQGEELLSYADRILSLHDEALLSLSKTGLNGRILPGLTEDTDLLRSLTPSRPLSPASPPGPGTHKAAHEPCLARHAGAGRTGCRHSTGFCP